MSDQSYTPDETDVRAVYREQMGDYADVADEFFDRFIAQVKRDAAREGWDHCYHQMVTAPARGVIVTPQSNPYAPVRRVTPYRIPEETP